MRIPVIGKEIKGWVLASDIATRIQDLRGLFGWTQTQLGDEVGRDYQQVSGWETGASKPPRGVLARLARRRGWPISIFSKDGPLPSGVLLSDGTVKEPTGTDGTPNADVLDMAPHRIAALVQESLDYAKAKGRDPDRVLAALLLAIASHLRNEGLPFADLMDEARRTLERGEPDGQTKEHP